MQPFPGITRCILKTWSLVKLFSHWLMLSVWRGGPSWIIGVTFCWCGGKRVGWGILGLTDILAFHLPRDLDWGFHISVHILKMQASEWPFLCKFPWLLIWQNMLSVVYAVGGGGRKERRGLLRVYSLKGTGEDLNIQLLCKWIWWQ